jgi:hypothetical protein
MRTEYQLANLEDVEEGDGGEAGEAAIGVCGERPWIKELGLYALIVGTLGSLLVVAISVYQLYLLSRAPQIPQLRSPLNLFVLYHLPFFASGMS